MLEVKRGIKSLNKMWHPPSHLCFPIKQGGSHFDLLFLLGGGNLVSLGIFFLLTSILPLTLFCSRSSRIRVLVVRVVGAHFLVFIVFVFVCMCTHMFGVGYSTTSSSTSYNILLFLSSLLVLELVFCSNHLPL